MLKCFALAAALAVIGTAPAFASCSGTAAGTPSDDTTRNAPERPRDEQLCDFASRLQAYSHTPDDVDIATGQPFGGATTVSFSGTAIAIGDSHTAQFPYSDLKADFGTNTANTANFGISGATVEEVWWMVRRLHGGFRYNGVMIRGIDTSNINKVLILDLGGNTVAYTPDSSADIAAQDVGLIQDLLPQIQTGARILVTEKMEFHDNNQKARIDALNQALASSASTSGLYDFLRTPHAYAVYDVNHVAHYGDRDVDQDGQLDGDHSDAETVPPDGSIHLYKSDQVHYLDLFYTCYVDPVVYGFFHSTPQQPACTQ